MDGAALEGIPVFAGLSRRDRTAIARHADEVSAPAGTVLLREGEMGMEVMVVLDGNGRVTVGEAEVATVGPGDVIGEIGVVGGLHRTATVTATTDMRVLVIFGPEFRTVTHEFESVRRRILDLIATRVERSRVDPG